MFRSRPVRTRKRGFFEDRLPDSRGGAHTPDNSEICSVLAGKKIRLLRKRDGVSEREREGEGERTVSSVKVRFERAPSKRRGGWRSCGVQRGISFN